MEQYIWLFPIIFIFHDMEEIIGFKLWMQKNRKMLEEKYPFVLKAYPDFSTEGFAVAVYEELILSVIFSGLAFYTKADFFGLLWLGAFIACTLHFVIHIVQAVVVRQYIPAVITSVICLPVSIRIILKCVQTLECRRSEAVLFGLCGILAAVVNLKFAQSLIGKFTRKMRKYME